MVNRVLIIGLGSIGKCHLRIARELMPASDIRVLRHQHTIEIPEYANGCFFTLDDAVAFLPHIAVIANPSPFHIATAQALAAVGVSLLIEKPLSATLNGVRQLLDICRIHRSVLLTGYNLRFLPSLQHFRKLLGEGVIGKILSVRCEIGQFLPSWRPGGDYRQEVTANQKLGGGALLELSHEIDYMRWIFGEVDWVTSTLSRQSSLEIDVEDTAHLILGFAKQAGGHQLIGSLNLDLIRHDTTRSCTVIGEHGSLHWDGLLGKVIVYTAEEKAWRELFHYQHQRDESYRTEWHHFLECVSGKSTPMITGEDGLRVLEIIEAARISAASGKRVALSASSKYNEIDS